jgi:hypothetical protein
MSKNYAVVENDIVKNVIFADSIEIASEVTGLECIETDGSFWIGWSRVDGVWIAPVEPVEEPVEEPTE